MEIPGYRLGKVIGQGGMGRVYAGEQLTLQRRVAVKVLAPELTEDQGLITRFKLEIALLSGIVHPHIVRIIDSGTAAGTFYYAMEFCEGGTLKSRLIQAREVGPPVTPEEAVELGAALLDGLEAVHGRKILHRDIKPGNVFFGEGGRPVLGDFGLARQLDGVRVTMHAQAMGTPLYMSPEARLAEDLDHRADLFQIARMLYEMLSGEDPGQSAPVWLRLAPGGAPPLISAANPLVSDDLASVIARSLSWKREDRHQDAHSFREELLGVNPRADPSARPRLPPPPQVTAGVVSARTAPRARAPSGPTPRPPTPRGTDTVPPSAGVPPIAMFVAALAIGLSFGVWLFRAPVSAVAVAPRMLDTPRAEAVRIEWPGPVLDVSVAPAAELSVSTGGRTLKTAGPSTHHRITLDGLSPGRSIVGVALGSAPALTIVTVPIVVPYSGGPSRHCLGLTMKDGFDFGKHVNDPAAYDDALLASVAAAGVSAITVLVDPTVDDPGILPTVEAIRRHKIEVTYSLYLDRFPAKPDAVKAKVRTLIDAVAKLDQKQVYFSVSILIDTLGWIDGYPRYAALLALVQAACKDAPIPSRVITGNLYRPGTESLVQLLAAGAGQYITGVVLTHWFPLKVGPRPPTSMAPLIDVATAAHAKHLEWIFDVPDPEEGQGSGLLDNDVLGSALADPGLRDAAVAADQRSKRDRTATFDPAREELLFGPRMRETVRLLTSGARAVMWDLNMCRDPAEDNRLRLRCHSTGIRMMLDFVLTGPASEVQMLTTDAQRSRFGLTRSDVQGVARESGGGIRLMLWTEETPRGRVLVPTERPALVTALLQPHRGPFTGRLVEPSKGAVEIPVSWSPTLVELAP